MKYLRIKNWEAFQHYKDRNPPWIKLHRSLLDDYEFSALEDVAKGQLMLIWLFASQNEGKIPQDAKFLERKLGLTEKCRLDALIAAGFLIPDQPASSSASADASEPIATCEQDASKALSLACSREERQRTKATETEGRAAFEDFWSAWPRKVAKSDAEKAWRKVSAADVPAVMAGLAQAVVCEQWRKDGGQFIPHAATWLNGRRWEDQVQVNGAAASSELDSWLAQTGHGGMQ